MKEVRYVNSTNHAEIALALGQIFSPYKSGHFTNGTYAPPADLIIPTTLAGFQCVTQKTARTAPLVIAVNSDKSMQALKKEDFELQAARAAKVAMPLALTFPHNQVVIIYYDEQTPEALYATLKKHSLTKTLHKWGYGITPEGPKIEGAEHFDLVYAFPLLNDKKPVCYYDTQKETKSQQNIKIVDLQGALISEKGVLFPLPEGLQKYAAKKERISPAPSP